MLINVDSKSKCNYGNEYLSVPLFMSVNNVDSKSKCNYGNEYLSVPLFMSVNNFARVN